MQKTVRHCAATVITLSPRSSPSLGIKHWHNRLNEKETSLGRAELNSLLLRGLVRLDIEPTRNHERSVYPHTFSFCAYNTSPHRDSSTRLAVNLIHPNTYCFGSKHVHLCSYSHIKVGFKNHRGGNVRINKWSHSGHPPLMSNLEIPVADH